MTSTVDPENLKQFTNHADEWWDPNGAFKPLHELNPERMRFIRDEILTCGFGQKDTLKALKGVTICDVGCGGGIVCEPLTRLGASVVGLDAGLENIEAAKAHAKAFDLNIRYENLTSHEFLEAYPKEKFDVVLALEIVEHVENLQAFIHSCVDLTKPGGLILFSTLNRTLKSYAFGIVAAEYILKWVPKGTHSWQKFLKPSELGLMLEDANCTIQTIKGLSYAPLSKDWHLSDDLDINYFLTTRTSNDE